MTVILLKTGIMLHTSVFSMLSFPLVFKIEGNCKNQVLSRIKEFNYLRINKNGSTFKFHELSSLNYFKITAF